MRGVLVEGEESFVAKTECTLGLWALSALGHSRELSGNLGQSRSISEACHAETRMRRQYDMRRTAGETENRAGSTDLSGHDGDR